MSESIHINRPSSTRFIARVRLRGARNYKLVGKPFLAEEMAAKAMIKEFTKGLYYRGDVLLVADWYDPIVTMEMRRR